MTVSGPERPWVRDCSIASLFALWCLLWPAGLVLIVDSSPEFVSWLRGSTPRVAIEALSPLSYRMTLFAFAMTTFVGMFLLLRLRRWLDPEAWAVGSLRWAFSSTAFNGTVLLLAMALAGVVFAGQSEDVLTRYLENYPDAVRFFVEWWFPITLAVSAAINIPALFWLLNPDTLARDRLECWWRPFWPGTVALIMTFLCWVLVPEGMEQVDKHLPSMTSVPKWITVQALGFVGYAIGLLCDLLVFSFLFSRSRLLVVRDVWRRLLSWSTMRTYVGLDVLILACWLAVAAPVLSLAAFEAYLVPPIEMWRQETGTDPPAILAALVDGLKSLHAFEPLLLLLLTASIVWPRLVLGRLLQQSVFGAPAGQIAHAPGSER